MGPVYVFQAIVQLFTGTSFFREVGTGNSWYEQIISSFDETAATTTSSSSLGADVGLLLVGLLSLILLPVAEAAIIVAINHIKNGENYSVGMVMKQAFSRFWPLFGSSILFGLIIFGLIIIPIIIVILVGVFGSIVNPIIGILLAFALFLCFAIGIGYLLTRWSFFFGSVVLEKNAPGLSRSWALTKKRTWVSMGLYIVFLLIIGCISMALELAFGMFLGNSVLLNIIVNVVSIFTTMIFIVGYAVMFLDLKTRNDAEDLKEMIEDYNNVK
jgi:hypothetical protein